MNAMAYTYVAYLATTIGITIWVARILRHNGTIFLAKSEADQPLAEALSHLLIVGFYLINFGVISFAMKSQERVVDAQTGIELFSTKVGVIMVALGMMHFVILMIFSVARQNNDHQRTLADRRHAVDQLTALNLGHR
ncbi:MAG: hypothetical protein U0872_13235 [Planctomycetaceae bacterium]